MVAIAEIARDSLSGHLRPLNIHRDLLAVADLIELCFASTMDADGKQYLRQMRQLGRDEGYSRWMLGDLEHSPTPFSGFVWEEDGKLVGNLNLIPLAKQGEKIYFIANVAVDPNFRRRGIARALTEAALDFAQKRLVSRVWLQVREDNLQAYHLYQSEGFIDRARRHTWQALPEKFKNPIRKEPAILITRRNSTDWGFQQTWLNHNYPPDVSWNLSVKIENFKPSFFTDLGYFLNGQSVNHWVARLHGQLAGILTFETTLAASDNLWLAASPDEEDLVITSLIPYVIHSLNTRRPLSLNYPAGRAEDAFTAAGLTLHQTLIWMETTL